MFHSDINISKYNKMLNLKFWWKCLDRIVTEYQSKVWSRPQRGRFFQGKFRNLNTWCLSSSHQEIPHPEEVRVKDRRVREHCFVGRISLGKFKGPPAPLLQFSEWLEGFAAWSLLLGTHSGLDLRKVSSLGRKRPWAKWEKYPGDQMKRRPTCTCGLIKMVAYEDKMIQG